MALPFDTVGVVDDDPSARLALAYPVEEASLTPALIEGPVGPLEEFWGDLLERAGAIITDHQLKVRDYAPFNGAELAAFAYDQHVPGILCTRYDRAKESQIRPLRSRIPVMLGPDELDPDSIVFGLELCLKEFEGYYHPTRKPWRTLVRVEEVFLDGPEAGLNVVVPAWRPSVAIHLPLDDELEELATSISAVSRLFAEVNVGAEEYGDLYFKNWAME